MPRFSALTQMDVISILGPSGLQRSMNQDEFDARFSYISPTEKSQQKDEKAKWRNCLSRCMKEDWIDHKSIHDYLPALQWALKYGMKSDLPRDLAGSILLACLFLPQAVTAGVLAVDNAYAGIYALVFPQLIYPLFGSSRHSSIGALSFVSLLVQSSIANSGTNAAGLALVSALVHFLLVILPLDPLIALIPDTLLSGFAAGLSLRLLGFFFSHAFTLNECTERILEVQLSSLPSCLLSSTGWLLLLASIVLLLLSIAHFLTLIRFTNSIPVTPPFQLAVMVASIALSYTLDLPGHGISVLGKGGFDMNLQFPTVNPSTDHLLDGAAIAFLGICLHIRIAKTIAIEKMHTINRKQELLSFFSFTLPLSLLGLPPVGSAHGKSQLNVETARFSLVTLLEIGQTASDCEVANIIAIIWIILFTSFGGSILAKIPYCVVAALALTSFPGLMGEWRMVKRLMLFSKVDASIWVVSFLLSLLCPNSCKGFLLAAVYPLVTIVLRVQRPSSDVLSRLSLDAPAYFGEEGHYEADPTETPAKVYRFNASLLFPNCDQFRREIAECAKTIKGAMALGIGTRTASMRSQLEIFDKKDSIKTNSRLNLANIVINQEPCTPPNASMDSSLVRVLIIDCSTLSDIDSHGVDTLIDIYFELQEQSIRVIFASLSVRVRATLSAGGFFSRVSRGCLYPTLSDAHTAARHAILPIHMSVSMNGCRDIIALSTATSNHELMDEGHVEHV
ncbi:sulp-1 [Pristionchus pacificus]|uniref:Sulp-1 n=1 Tax=Pristionchus pacificus TaxID=54126 RepID=A0A2A6BPV0_PRIPA|nr:sulp-1 [Pristionchus pacificus]|eukprot:PDM67930.1 sulp-1 [Pristionchus pacificus]